MNCPKCHGPLQFVHLPDSIDVESCPCCSGAFYDLGELAVDVAMENLMASAYFCPKCGGAMQTGTAFSGQLTLERCPGCKGLWFDPGEIQKLRSITGKDRVVGRPSPGEPEPAPPLAAPPAPAPQPSPQAPGLGPATREQIMAAFAQRIGAKPSARKDGSPSKKGRSLEIEDSGTAANPDLIKNPSVLHDARKYLHFQTSRPMVGYVLGEFNWRVAVGDKAVARDFVCPPFIISEDKTPEDTAWSLGEYIEPREIWDAFKLPGEPPPRTGVAPAQPNPHEEAYQSVTAAFWKLAAACFLIYSVMAFISQNKVIQTFPFQHALADPEKSRVTFPFDITGRTSNVRVRINSNVDNQWAAFELALINTQTDEAVDFGREVGYWHGVDGGESWSEGSRSDTVYLPSVKPGSYYLRVEPETDSPNLAYSVELTRDAPRISYLLYAWILLLVPPLWVWWRRRSFEVDRWQESDHPWVAESDDDDD